MPPVKSEGTSASLKSEQTAASVGNPRSRNNHAAAKKEEEKRDLPPPPPTTYRDIPIFSTDAGPWLTHLMKFAHHTRVDPSDTSQFVPPLKLNRKNPPRPKLPRPSPGDPVTDKYGRPMLGKDGQPLTWPAPGEDLTRIEEVIRKEEKPKAPGADQSLIAPGSNARVPKAKLFQKKVKEVHKAADATRKTMKQEYFPWVLEDFETSEEWESTRVPIPTGAKALEGWIDELKAKGQHAGAEGSSGQAKDGDAAMSADVKRETGVKQEAAGAQPSSSHAPWIGKLEGDSDENATSHHVLFVFDERDAGGFKVVPVTRMYKFLQKPKHSTLSNEEVELEYQKFQKNKEMDRWAMRKARGEGGPSSATAVKAEGASSSWSGWPGVGRLSLPSGGSSGGGGGGGGGGGRRRNLMAVHGGALLNDDDDDGGSRRRKREDDGGTYGELDYEEEFADDEEKMDEGDPYAEDEETRELEERLKREMARANKIGDDAEDEDVEGEGSAAEDDNNDQMLTGSGKQMMKIMRALARRDGNEVYEKDDEERNPYATDESDEDEEETYVANPEKAMQIAREEREKREREAAKNKGKATPATATASGSQTPTGRAEKRPQPSQHPSAAQQQRAGAGHANVAQRATSPSRTLSMKGSRPTSRSSSPNPTRATSPPTRAESPAGGESRSSPPPPSSAGVKRKTETPGTPISSGTVGNGSANTAGGAVPTKPDANKRIKTANGSRAGSPSGSPRGSRPGSRAGSPGAGGGGGGPRVPANAVEAEIIQLVREGKIANTSELVHHFRKRLKTEPQIKELLSAAVRKVAVMDKATNKLRLKDGF